MWKCYYRTLSKYLPNAVQRFKNLINLNAYDNVAFHRVIKDKLSSSW